MTKKRLLMSDKQLMILSTLEETIDNQIDNRIDSYLKDKSIAADFQSSMRKLKEKLLVSVGNI